MNDQHASAVPPTAGEHLWSAHDIAERFGRSVVWARQALARWRTAGLIAPVGQDSITGANLYQPEQVLAARQTDLHNRPT